MNMAELKRAEESVAAAAARVARQAKSRTAFKAGTPFDQQARDLLSLYERALAVERDRLNRLRSDN